MLLLCSELRKKLLAFYCTNVDGSYYVRELARILQVDPTNLSRELHALCKQGLFTVEQKGNQKHFRLNKKYPAFPELKSMILKTVGIVGALRQALVTIAGLRVAVVYGSFAKGEEDSASDVDVLLIGDVSAEEVLDAITPLEKRFGRDINTTTYSPREFQRKRKKDPFLRDVLNGKHIVLHGTV